MTIKKVLFFALKEDILCVLESVERIRPLKYVRAGHLLTAESESFTRAADLPNLGKASASSSINCEWFLVAEWATAIDFRMIKASERFCVDQLVNSDAVSFTPAGIWDSGIVLHGRVATASEAAISRELMNRFSSAFKEHFTKIKAFAVGP
jgi:hypothetical protein